MTYTVQILDIHTMHAGREAAIDAVANIYAGEDTEPMVLVVISVSHTTDRATVLQVTLSHRNRIVLFLVGPASGCNLRTMVFCSRDLDLIVAETNLLICRLPVAFSSLRSLETRLQKLLIVAR